MKWHEIKPHARNQMFWITSPLVVGSNNLIKYSSSTCPSMMQTSNGCTVSFPTNTALFWNFFKLLKNDSCELHSRQIFGADAGMPSRWIMILSPVGMVRRFHVEQQHPLPLFSSLHTQMDLRMEHGALMRTTLRICLDNETAYKPFLGVCIHIPLRDDLKTK